MKLKTINKTKCGIISPNEVYQHMELLAKKLEKIFDCSDKTCKGNASWCNHCTKPSYIYGVPRGGLPIAVYLSHRLGIPMIDELGISQLDHILMRWDRVLVVDDIFDTGKTYEQYKNKCWGFACLYYKQKVISGELVSIPNLIYVKEVPDIPIIFPWENAEQVIEDLKRKEETKPIITNKIGNKEV